MTAVTTAVRAFGSVAEHKLVVEILDRGGVNCDNPWSDRYKPVV
ncbi:hypothetical protein [Rhodococcus sp. KBS0724]|jgi:hypothetical protein|nr:hypothetical protein [Rhodococcus sp. KBS0724]